MTIAGLGSCHGVVNAAAINILALKRRESPSCQAAGGTVGFKASSDYEIVSRPQRSRLTEILPSNVLGFNVCGSDVGGHVNVSASLLQGFWRAVEHLVRVAYVVTYQEQCRKTGESHCHCAPKT